MSAPIPPSIQPLSNLCLVKPDEKEDWLRVGDSKILLPSTAEISIPTGVVLATGPGLQVSNGTIMPMRVKAGDRIVVNPQSIQLIIHQGQPHYLVHENDICAIVIPTEITLSLN